jgi:hypothetical protein
MSRQILNGWKEVSSHLKRSVRTVQRWEARLGLPVYRPALKDRSAVVAFSDELDRWVSRASPGARDEDAVLGRNDENNESILRMLEDMSALVWDTSELASQMRHLHEQLQQSFTIHHNAIAPRTRARTASPPGRGMGPVLTFRSRKQDSLLESTFVAGDVRGVADQSGSIANGSPVERTYKG